MRRATALACALLPLAGCAPLYVVPDEEAGRLNDIDWQISAEPRHGPANPPAANPDSKPQPAEPQTRGEPPRADDTPPSAKP